MDRDTLFTLHKRGLITDEVLAQCLNEMYSKKDVGLTEEEKRQALINENRKKAEENRKNVEEIREKYRNEYIMRKREESIKELSEFLKRVTNKDGNRVYSDKDISNMSYVELQYLYDQITNRMSPEEINKIKNSNVAEEPTHNSIDLNTLLNQSIEKRTDALNRIKEEIKTADVDVEEPMKEESSFKPATFEEQSKEEALPAHEEPAKYGDIPEDTVYDQVVPSANDEVAEVPVDFNDPAEHEEPKKITSKREATTEEKNTFKKSKWTVKAALIKAGLLAASSFVLFAVAGPLAIPAGIVGYNILAHNIKKGTWNPKNSYLQALKGTILKTMQLGKKEPDVVEEGGKVR